ncbi:AraC-like ligand binding domain protein|nr:AraC-like ligand binding domain protein [Candidatus Pantoea persica]
MPDYPGALQSAGRYVAFGLIALPLAWHDRRRLRQLLPADWREALKLSLVGNLLYYTFLASVIQRTGAPVSTMIIGTLPVVMAITANLCYGHLEGRLTWRKLIPALLAIGGGLVCVNIAELRGQSGGGDITQYLSGIALPLTLVMYGLVCAQLAWQHPDFALPFGPQPHHFLPLMLLIGLLCSWLGTLCWNAASQRLPTVLMGPLIVFETLSGLLWTFVWRQSWSPLLTATGILLLIVGVLWAMRIKPQPIVTSIEH